jgi:hypothetical protein
MKRIIRLTESDLTRIVKQVIQEQSEHVKNLYKSWANKRSGNPEEALKLMDDVFKYQKQLSKKDFAQYSSYEELRRDLVKIKSEERSTDATKLYEDGELLVLAANTWEASCKYGAGSKWCTTARDTDSDWRRHNQTGTEFFWIFKNKPQDDPNHKFSYHIKIDGSDPDWCNAVNNCMSTRRLPEESYPKQHPKYNEIIEKLQEFHNARDMKNVNQISNTRTVQFENQRTIYELINENAPQIMRLLMDNGINETIMDNYEMSIETYLDSEVYDNLPDDLYEYDDDDAIKEYISDLEKHLLSKDMIITFDRDMFYGMIRDLSYLVYNFLLDRNNLNAGEYLDEQDINIVGVINDLINDNNYRYQYEEVIYEFVSLEASYEIYFNANKFRDKYEK